MDPDNPTEPRWLDTTQQQAWQGLLVVFLHAFPEIERTFKAHDLLSVQYGILVALAGAPDRTLRLNELADLSNTSQSRLTHRLRNLIARGDIEISDDPDDGRAKNATLTEAGTRRLDSISPIHAEDVQHVIFDQLTPEQTVAFADALSSIAATLCDHGNSDPTSSNTTSTRVPRVHDPRGDHSVALTDVDDSVLVVVDVQQSFLDKLEPGEVTPLVNRIAWIVRIAVKFGVPIVATAEDIDDRGTTVPQVADGFPAGTEHHDKMFFGLAGDPAILAAVEQHGRRTAVVVGLETDVCVMQSALGLLQEGFRVVILSDATASPGPCHEAGLTRIRDAGAIVSTVKGTFYEWVRGLDAADQRLGPEVWTDPRPDGIQL